MKIGSELSALSFVERLSSNIARWQVRKSLGKLFSSLSHCATRYLLGGVSVFWHLKHSAPSRHSQRNKKRSKSRVFVLSLPVALICCTRFFALVLFVGGHPVKGREIREEIKPNSHRSLTWTSFGYGTGESERDGRKVLLRRNKSYNKKLNQNV